MVSESVVGVVGVVGSVRSVSSVMSVGSVRSVRLVRLVRSVRSVGSVRSVMVVKKCQNSYKDSRKTSKDSCLNLTQDSFIKICFQDIRLRTQVYLCIFIHREHCVRGVEIFANIMMMIMMMRHYIIRFIAHHVQDGYTLVENTLMTIKNPWEKKVSQNKWDTETSTT